MNIYPFTSNQADDVFKIIRKELEKIYSENEIKIIFQRILEHFGYSEFKLFEQAYLNQSELIKISEWIKELKQKKPLSYILGYTYFYNLKLYVNESVLIPRPETEEMIFQLSDIISKEYTNLKSLKIIDIGTGSGCIAIALKKLFPCAEIDAIDISSNALNIAQKNAIFHHVKINFQQQDILKEELSKQYDIIVSNPPYIPTADACQIDDTVKKYEPAIALFSDTATVFYERIFYLSENYLNANGLIMMEINQYYSQKIYECAKQYSLQCKILRDWSNNERFILCKKIKPKRIK